MVFSIASEYTLQQTLKRRHQKLEQQFRQEQAKMGGTQGKEMENTAVVIGSNPQPASAKYYMSLLIDKEKGDDARYLMQHAVNKGVQYGSMAGMLLGTTFMITRGGGFKAVRLWSSLGGFFGAFAGIGMTLKKAEDDILPMDDSGIKHRVSMLKQNEMGMAIDKAAFYGGCGGLLLTRWPLCGVMRVGGWFAGTAMATAGAHLADKPIIPLIDKIDSRIMKNVREIKSQIDNKIR